MYNWWHDRVVYQIYPRSFQDTNGDGIGDIPGIIRHLNELKDLGIGIIWLSPVYPSPNADNGYDISDYCGIHPDFGTMSDMDRLIDEAKKLDIKIIMDLVINHTSDEHPWFQQSRDKNSPYRDYYIWRPAKNGKQPNNWTSFFAEDCWEYDEKSNEYYLHLFAKKQPDLNYNNPKVLEEIKNVMRFWLEKGIAGFRCDVINVIYKTSLDDGKKKLVLTGSEHYISQEGAHKILNTLRKDVLDNFDCFTVGETVFVTPQTGKALCDESRHELNMIFSFEHMDTDQYFVKWFKRKFQGGRFASTIAKWQNALFWNANYLENHDQPRSVSRFGNDGEYWEQSAKMLCMLLLSLRGTPYIFQGQEIGMTNFDFTSMEQVQDVESHNVFRKLKGFHIPTGMRWKMIKASSRDNARTPVQWSSKTNAGFTSGKPWLAINKNYTRINMEAQMNDPNSIRSFYKSMIALRAGSPVLKYGTFRSVKICKNIFIFRREFEGDSLTILINFSQNPQSAPASGSLILSSYARKAYDNILKPYEAIIIKQEDTL